MSWKYFRIQIGSRFSLEEVKTLCFDLSVEFDELQGEIKSGKIRELIKIIKRTNRIHVLVSELNKRRPDVDWEALIPENTQSEFFEPVDDVENQSLFLVCPACKDHFLKMSGRKIFTDYLAFGSVKRNTEIITYHCENCNAQSRLHVPLGNPVYVERNLKFEISNLGVMVGSTSISTALGISITRLRDIVNNSTQDGEISDSLGNAHMYRHKSDSNTQVNDNNEINTADDLNNEVPEHPKSNDSDVYDDSDDSDVYDDSDDSDDSDDFDDSDDSDDFDDSDDSDDFDDSDDYDDYDDFDDFDDFDY